MLISIDLQDWEVGRETGVPTCPLGSGRSVVRSYPGLCPTPVLPSLRCLASNPRY